MQIKPFILETSKGYINLALVQMIRTHRNRDVAELVFHSGDVVELSIKEWDLLYGAIVPYIIGVEALGDQGQLALAPPASTPRLLPSGWMARAIWPTGPVLALRSM
jgi:hypothetical protein